MSKQLTFFLFICTIIQAQAQENRLTISGRIMSDASSLENIHILNKNSNSGTISNVYGDFKIPVKENDTLVFSGIQFYKKEMRITEEIIENKIINVKLFQKINELEEVEVRIHNLSGNLTTDASKIKDTISKISVGALDFSMIDFSKPVIGEIDRSKPPDISRLTNPHFQIGIGASFSIGAVKKKRTQTIPEKIRAALGNNFFTKTLNIPLEQIEPFIKQCESQGIFDLYMKNRKMEVIDILIKESKIYKK